MGRIERDIYKASVINSVHPKPVEGRIMVTDLNASTGRAPTDPPGTEESIRAYLMLNIFIDFYNIVL
jgi:hypothetical protein